MSKALRRKKDARVTDDIHMAFLVVRHGWSLQEVAGKYGISEAAVKRRMEPHKTKALHKPDPKDLPTSNRVEGYCDVKLTLRIPVAKKRMQHQEQLVGLMDIWQQLLVKLLGMGVSVKERHILPFTQVAHHQKGAKMRKAKLRATVKLQEEIRRDVAVS